MLNENWTAHQRISLTPKQICFQQWYINILMATGLQKVKYRILLVWGDPVTIRRETRTAACWLVFRTGSHVGQICAQGLAICSVTRAVAQAAFLILTHGSSISSLVWPHRPVWNRVQRNGIGLSHSYWNLLLFLWPHALPHFCWATSV